jgi:hypothetical protein
MALIGSQRVDFDLMAGFALIAASVEYDSLLLWIAAGVDFRGHRLLTHPRKGKWVKISWLPAEWNRTYLSSFAVGWYKCNLNFL